MNENRGLEQIAGILKEIHDNQKLQLERQAESLSLQREHLLVVQRQFEKADRINDRAEAIQARSSQLIDRVRKFVPAVFVIVVILILYLTWLLSRMGVL